MLSLSSSHNISLFWDIHTILLFQILMFVIENWVLNISLKCLTYFLQLVVQGFYNSWPQNPFNTRVAKSSHTHIHTHQASTSGLSLQQDPHGQMTHVRSILCSCTVYSVFSKHRVSFPLSSSMPLFSVPSTQKLNTHCNKPAFLPLNCLSDILLINKLSSFQSIWSLDDLRHEEWRKGTQSKLQQVTFTTFSPHKPDY